MIDQDDQFILASTSPARAAILRQTGYRFSTVAPDLDEAPIKTRMQDQGRSAENIAIALAGEKAQAVSKDHVGKLVIGADQTLDIDGVLIDKAQSLDELAKTLKKLRGKTHMLHSAAVVYRNGEELFSVSQAARMDMKDFSDDFLDAYLAKVGQDVLGCVGGYMFEGSGAHLFSRVEGDHFTILGLPMLKLSAGLDQLGVKVFS